ncbi:TPA: amidase [Pseudomonas aeruginosa]|nr:amidase [Pseudomonas aeruginosa]HEJ1204052.1 amidase [Pseudomonas aeruginosa]HEJ5398195.1 amidase [Pseudomonas aeruginosa]
MNNFKKPLHWPSVGAVLNALRNGDISVETIVSKHLDVLVGTQASLNAATKIYIQRALQEAKEMDERGDRSLPLFGIPCSVKETFGVANEQITAGSNRMNPIQSNEDSRIVQRLRAAGAIIVARSNTPEFAMAAETINLRYGRTNNPLDTSRTAGGSSGGEGALVAAGATLFGVGSDILGSIRIPAAFCGIVGFKPHSGAIDKTGTWPVVSGYSKNWLALGPLTRTVSDARLVYNVIANNAVASDSPLPKRIITPVGFPIDYQQPCIEAAVDCARNSLIHLGLSSEETDFSDVPKFFKYIPKVIFHDFYKQWMELLSSSDFGRFSIFKEIIAKLNRKPTIDSGLFSLILLGSVLTPRSNRKVENIIFDLEKASSHYHRVLGGDSILILPTIGLVAPKHGGMNKVSIAPGVNGLFTAHTLANYFDLSAIAVPAWKFCDPATGMPPSVSLLCAPGAESSLFAAAEVVEKVLN